MPEKQVRITPLTAIVCDQIRTEDNGKKLLIGVYTGDIVVDRPPEDMPSPLLPLSFLLPVSVSAAGSVKIEVEVRSPDENKRTEIRGVAQFEGEERFLKRIYVEFNGIPVSIEKEGPVTLSFKQGDDKDWQEICSFNLMFRDSLPSSVSSPSTNEKKAP